ncbi:right-handed parallel beta-helix repeat-containing protein [Halobacillus karajensis]|uniref:Uncharacterized protein n=1 Tax=Halobacillus karajensis TaxID=195088 RepID=A0A059NXQ5_9BACI|nr:right-handed parallel beta-helix repeat-containing protein [Halobacillus karajensis]CDQ22566.1 hypothetical protein BN983_00779 [Halobacillus karajensis]CDQ26048.1 hypothetical protein BN981_00259 [Halobacillus karajensis]
MIKAVNSVDLISEANVIKQGDTVNSFTVKLYDKDGAPVDVSGSNVTWNLFDDDGRVIADRAVTKESEPGVITLGISSTDSTGHGTFEVEIKVESSAGTEFFPAEGKFFITINRNSENLEETPVAYATLTYFQDSVDETKANSQQAVETADEAKVTADNAKQQSSSTQTQLDQIVVDGDSSVEAAQARVRDIKGETKTFTTLKERNDDTDSKLRDITVNIKQNGALGDGSDDTAAIQSVLDTYAGKTILIPYGSSFNVTSLTIPLNTQIIGYGAKIYNDSTHSTIINLETGVEIIGLEIEGLGNSSYNSSGIGIGIKGTWNSTLRVINYVQDIKLTDCYIHDLGAYGIHAEYARNIKVSGGKIQHVGYAGIGGLSVDNVHVFNKMHIKEVSPGTSGNTYGVFFSRKSTTDDLEELPHSQNCSVSGCTIEDAPLWEALDTHGGQNIEFLNNTIRNCKVGIAFVSIDDLDSNPLYAPKKCKAHGNDIQGIGTGVGIIATGAITAVGSPVEYADRISIQGNTLTECGIKGNDAAGAIEIYGTRGASIVGNTSIDSYPHGISIYHTNQGFTVQGNTIVDPQDETVVIVSGVVIRSTHNSGVVSGNSFIKVKESTTSLNVAKRGIYLASQSNNLIHVGPNYNTFEIKQNGLEGQAVRFNSEMGNSSFGQFAGLGSPEGNITAPMGSTYINRGGGAGSTFYIKESGSGNTGWVAK